MSVFLLSVEAEAERRFGAWSDMFSLLFCLHASGQLCNAHVNPVDFQKSTRLHGAEIFVNECQTLSNSLHASNYAGIAVHSTLRATECADSVDEIWSEKRHQVDNVRDLRLLRSMTRQLMVN